MVSSTLKKEAAYTAETLNSQHGVTSQKTDFPQCLRQYIFLNHFMQGFVGFCSYSLF